jgi:pimeloyl-ACP methyl ester carboxylesterase
VSGAAAASETEPTLRIIEANGIKIRIAEMGKGPLVLFLHGFPESWYSWRHQLPALAKAGYRAVAPDLRGYGKSDRPPAVEDYAAPKLVGDVAGLIRALGHESAHVVGHDWGGGLAWGLAGNRPEMVRSLTILNAPVGPVSARLRREDPDQRAKSWYMLLFQFPGVAETWLSQEDFRNLREFVFDQAPEAFPPEDRAQFIAALRRDGALTAALNWYRANMPPSSWLRDPPDPPPVPVPTMIIWGEADAYMDPILLERSAATVTGMWMVRASCFSKGCVLAVMRQLTHRYRFSLTITRTGSSLRLRILTSISSVITLRLVSMLKSSCLRSPTTSKAEPSLSRMVSFFGVWSMRSSPMNSREPSAGSSLLTRTRPAGMGMPIAFSCVFLKLR